jgi:hypothetical protein
VRYAAYTLAHEFAHHNGATDEADAYDAGKAFALKMGDADIARGADEVKARVKEQERQLEDLLNRLRAWAGKPTDIAQLFREGTST